MRGVATALSDRAARHRRRLAESRKGEEGYLTILLAVLVTSGFLFAAMAISVDTSRWYDEMGRVQKAADAAALAGVPFLPFDMTNATLRAKEVAKRNGYDDASPDVVVKVARGSLSSQLEVTVSSRIHNNFGAFIGLSSTTLTRSGTADYKGPAPMGSPCNTFGNEPNAGTGVSSPAPSGTALGTTLPACVRQPDFWAGIEGVRTSKSNGDRYMNSYCATKYTNYQCTSTTNKEYDPTAAQSTPGKRGYIWVVRVQQAAVGQTIRLQLYDPAYINSGGTTCASLPASSGLDDNMNPFVTTDGKRRYSSDLSPALPVVGQGRPTATVTRCRPMSRPATRPRRRRSCSATRPTPRILRWPRPWSPRAA